MKMTRAHATMCQGETLWLKKYSPQVPIINGHVAARKCSGKISGENISSCSLFFLVKIINNH